MAALKQQWTAVPKLGVKIDRSQGSTKEISQHVSSLEQPFQTQVAYKPQKKTSFCQ